VLRALDMLRAAAEGTLSDAVAREGGVLGLLWDHAVLDRNGKVASVSWEVEADPVRWGQAAVPAQNYVPELQTGLGGSYFVSRENLVSLPQPGTMLPDQPRMLFKREGTRALVIDPQGHVREVPDNSVRVDGTLLAASTSLPFGPIESWLFRNRLMNFAVYQDIRAELRKAAVTRLDGHVSRDGQNLITVLHSLYTTDRPFRQRVDDALRAAFPDEYVELVFPPAADQRIQLRLKWRSLQTDMSAAELSDGVMRFLVLVAILANTQSGDLIAFDEHETGLHPRMLPIVAELAA